MAPETLPRRLTVLADSLSFHGPEGPVPLADGRLYPNLVAAHLADATGVAWDAAIIARAGWTTRDAWLALQRDVHLQQQELMGSAAVVLGIGSMDTLPVGLPRPVSALIPYLRPTPLRRRVRRAIDRHHAALVRLTGARLRWTPASVYRHGWRKTIGGIRLFAPDAALCAVLPAVHAGDYYARAHPHHGELWQATADMAAELDVPVVDLAALVRPFLGRMNPDGLHWSWEAHAAVAQAMADVLLPQLAPADGA